MAEIERDIFFRDEFGETVMPDNEFTVTFDGQDELVWLSVDHYSVEITNPCEGGVKITVYRKDDELGEPLGMVHVQVPAPLRVVS